MANGSFATYYMSQEDANMINDALASFRIAQLDEARFGLGRGDKSKADGILATVGYGLGTTIGTLEESYYASNDGTLGLISGLPLGTIAAIDLVIGTMGTLLTFDGPAA